MKPKNRKRISVRGRVFTGTVLSNAMQKTAVVEWQRIRPIKKYERYEIRRTKIKAHNPESINAQVGDKVRVGETRKLSKTKSFIIMEVLSKDQEEQK